MMLCPNCKSPGMDFTIGQTVHRSVRILCSQDGDYHEKDEDVVDCHWHWIRCSACDQEIDEDEARACFDSQPEEEPHAE